ncbi:MAG: hemolysin III family protein [Myxococcota bacterium]
MSLSESLARPRSKAEERANAVSHAVGLGLAGIGTIALIVIPAMRGLPLRSLTCGLFGLSATMTFLSSAAYHSAATEAQRQLWLKFDYSSIYLLIAGTYTPLALSLLTPEVGWALCLAEWGLALLGIVRVLQGRDPSTLFYIAMGSGGLVVLPALIQGIPVGGLVLLALGGLAYIVGAGFYVWQRLPYNHLIWHIAVILGVGFHYVAVLRYVALGSA